MNFEVITSRQNQFISEISKLRDKKYSSQAKSFLIDGIKLFEEAVNCGAEIEYVFLKDGSKNIIERAEFVLKSTNTLNSVKRILLLSESVFSKISEEKSPEGIICAIKYIDKLHKIATINNICENPGTFFSPSERIFMLEGIRDPGNLGTIIRSAAAFGVECLVISSDCADIYNAKTVRASMGSIFRQKIIRVEDLSAFVRELRRNERRIFATVVNDKSYVLGNVDLIDTDCFIIGNEGHGISHEIIELCNESIYIPMTIGSESLNAAAAATVCMWEQFGKK